MPQLKQEQIYSILLDRQQGFSMRAIARKLESSPSTISRLLKAVAAISNPLIQAEAVVYRRNQARKAREPYKYKGEIRKSCEALLRERRAPQEVVGRMKSLGMETVCHETIYKHIYKDRLTCSEFYFLLPRKHRKRVKRDLLIKPRGKISNPINIANRPIEAEKPITPGHLEADTVIFKGHKGAILTIVDRFTKKLYTRLLVDRTANRVKDAILNVVKTLPYKVLTLTVDNGKEFARHELITSKTQISIFFCNPYSSWERGLNEQTNGLLRRFIPKKTLYDQVNHKMLSNFTRRINSTYKKCLSYKTPIEFEKEWLLLSSVASQT